MNSGLSQIVVLVEPEGTEYILNINHLRKNIAKFIAKSPVFAINSLNIPHYNKREKRLGWLSPEYIFARELCGIIQLSHYRL